MNSLVKLMPESKKFNDYIEALKKKETPNHIFGLTDAAKALFSYATGFYTEKPICIVTYNEIQAKKLVKDLKYFSSFTDILFFPKRELITYDVYAESLDYLHERLNVLNRIYKKEKLVIVTTIEAVMQKMIKKEELYKQTLNIKVGEDIDLDNIKQTLVDLGYKRYDLIEGKGMFSVRGGIIDISPVDSNFGVRIELFGDTIDSIRYFDIVTQRSVEMVNNIEIFPSNEFKDLEINKTDKYFDDNYKEHEHFIDYLDNDYLLLLDEEPKIRQRLISILKENENLEENLIEKEKDVPQALKNQLTIGEWETKIENRNTTYLTFSPNMHAKRNGYSFSYREVTFFRSELHIFLQEMEKAKKEKRKIVILAGNSESAKRISETLFEKEISNIVLKELNKDLGNENVYVVEDSLSAGFADEELNLLVIAGEELTGTAKKKKVKTAAFREGEKIVFADLKIGDYVVHNAHGIGQFIGVNTIKTEKIIKDYIKIKYKGNDVLYIPTNQLDSIKKYVGAGDITPRLNKFGGSEWENTKAKVKSGLEAIAKELIELYAKRNKAEGFKFSPDTVWQSEFEEAFKYVETEDQLRCAEELKKSMEEQKPMDRLLCGDVGVGKTEVAMRGAFKACMDSKQVAYLVPTTILANQQYETFKKRMKDYPIKIEVLNRFRTKKEQIEIIKKLKLGEVDILIGTHRILQKDIEYKDLGFLIIDEEHRFGVKDKEKIKVLKNNIDVLTMTATPIPRTLHMSIIGIRDMSVIYEPPTNRRPVQTYVLEYDKEIVKEAVTREIEREGQVFYLYNKVETIVRKTEEIKQLVPEARVAFAHGQMTGTELENIMMEFINKKIDILVCTTILESGIDIPNANTIIVEDADRLGLAGLYQIRGRVGRCERQAYAYITYKRDKILTEVADKRLKAIKEFTEFGSGFKIALRDLEIRGAGSILGNIQHGQMDQVGYDMYLKLLDQVIKNMQGIEIKEDIEISIDINVSAYIPDEFIQSGSAKIEMYQNIALCKTREDIEDVIDEIIDRYGKFPKEVENLLEIAEIKILCERLGIIKVLDKKDKIILTYKDSQSIAFMVKDTLKDIKSFLKGLEINGNNKQGK